MTPRRFAERSTPAMPLGGTQPLGVFGAPTIEIRERLTVQRLVSETIAEHLLLACEPGAHPTVEKTHRADERVIRW
jgi:hypothetical protein